MGTLFQETGRQDFFIKSFKLEPRHTGSCAKIGAHAPCECRNPTSHQSRLHMVHFRPRDFESRVFLKGWFLKVVSAPCSHRIKAASAAAMRNEFLPFLIPPVPFSYSQVMHISFNFRWSARHRRAAVLLWRVGGCRGCLSGDLRVAVFSD